MPAGLSEFVGTVIVTAFPTSVTLIPLIKGLVSSRLNSTVILFPDIPAVTASSFKTPSVNSTNANAEELLSLAEVVLEPSPISTNCELLISLLISYLPR